MKIWSNKSQVINILCLAVLIFHISSISKHLHSLINDEIDRRISSIIWDVSFTSDSQEDDTKLEEVLEYGVVARASNWTGPVPCFKPDERMTGRLGYRSPVDSGFLFMKLQKTGGSTATGITMRIARNTAIRKNETFRFCRGRWDHSWAFHMLRNRSRSDSFTWTVVREPTRRAVSQYYHFQVSRENRSDSDDSFLDFLHDRRNLENYYLRTLALKRYFEVTDSEAPEIINQILADYDFMGTTERMDETAVALAMLLDLPLGDILYLDAKGKPPSQLIQRRRKSLILHSHIFLNHCNRKWRIR